MSSLAGTLEVKWFLAEESSSNLAPGDFVSLFHEWIRSDRLPDEMLIDVADYSHVNGGPGVVLVAHRAAYGIDSTARGLGLSYRLGPGPASSNRSRLELTFYRALRACGMLEEEGLRFRTDQVRLRFLDRLRVPSAEAARAEVEPVLERIFSGAGSLDLRELPQEDGEPFGFVFETATPIPLATLLLRLS